MVKKMIQKDLDSKGHLPILGGGPFNIGKGMVTDDSEMAMGLLRNLVKAKHEKNERPNQLSVYKRWLDSWPPDIGNTTRNALSSGQAQPSLSNGSLMRCSPLAIYGVNLDDDNLFDQVIVDDVNCVHSKYAVSEAVKCYVYCLRNLIRTGDVKESVELAYTKTEHKLVKAWIECSKKDDRYPVFLENYELMKSADGRGQGYVGLAFQLSMFQLQNSIDLESSMIEILSQGGDTRDPICCDK